jgi:hypothetical protein
MCCHAVKKLYKKKCQMEPDSFGKCRSFWEESELHVGSLSLSLTHRHTNARAHTKNVKLLVGVFWKVKIIENLRLLRLIVEETIISVEYHH